MKALFSCLTLLSLSLLGTAPVQASIFSLETSRSQIKVGDNFNLDLVVHDLFSQDPSDTLLAFGLNALRSDTGLLKLTGSTINPWFSEDSALLGLDVAGSAFPGIVSADVGDQPLVLATLHFQALAAGSGLISIESNLADFNQGLFFLNQGQVAINASHGLSITAVPLPPAALFFISGVLMSAGAFQKRTSQSSVRML